MYYKERYRSPFWPQSQKLQCQSCPFFNIARQRNFSRLHQQSNFIIFCRRRLALSNAIRAETLVSTDELQEYINSGRKGLRVLDTTHLPSRDTTPSFRQQYEEFVLLYWHSCQIISTQLFLKQINIWLEAVIVIHNPLSEILTNVLSNKKYLNMH